MDGSPSQDPKAPRFAADEARWREAMRRAQTGDREAYRRLLEELRGVLRAWLRSRLGDAPWLEDCVQETLVAVHGARHTYRPAHPFRPWLFAIARHKAIDALRRGATRARHEVPEAEEAGRSSHSPGDARDALLDAQRLLAGLDRAQREALWLTKYEGLSLEEAAAKAGVSRSAMKTRVHRAVRRVRAALEAAEARRD